MKGRRNIQDRTHGRSMVISPYGIVATEFPQAAMVGVKILEEGGTAADAAVAANAVMGVVAPMSCGIGGDLFCIGFEAKPGVVYGLNASGWSPAHVSIEALRRKGYREMPQQGVETITVPGTVDGWHQLLERFGTKTFQAVLAPAIRMAEDGCAVPEMIAELWRLGGQDLQEETALQTFLPHGRPPRVGDRFRNPALAWSYKQLAHEGRDVFYKGAIAERILAVSRNHDGPMTKEDLENYVSEWVDPLATDYRGWTVYEMPPNGIGIAALEMLNVLEAFPLADYGVHSADALHAMIEAKKVAYRDLLSHIGDPRHSEIGIEQLLAKDYARNVAHGIDSQKAVKGSATDRTSTAGDTICVSAVDRDGNMISLIQSLYLGFGSGIVPKGTGFALQNRGALFSLQEGHPNALAGRKRPLHTIIPALMTKGDTRIAFGIMGGWNQPQAHAQFVSHVVDFGMNIQAALDAPRFTKLTFEGADVLIESRIPQAVLNELRRRGHDLILRGAFSQIMGGGQAVLRDAATGMNYGASDPRKDGAAIPELS